MFPPTAAGEIPNIVDGLIGRSNDCGLELGKCEPLYGKRDIGYGLAGCFRHRIKSRIVFPLKGA